MPPCCGQVFPLKKTVAEMTALQAAAKFIPGQIYQITDAYGAKNSNSITLTACSGVTNAAIDPDSDLPMFLQGEKSGVTAYWLSGNGSPAIIGTGQTFSVTIASPGVFTIANHGLQVNDEVYLTTTGALPTGLAEDTPYYVISAGLTTNTFRLSDSVGGAAINTSVGQSGVHTMYSHRFNVGLFIEGEKIIANNGNCYTVSGVTMQSGAILNIRAFSKDTLEDSGFGYFINAVMALPVYAQMWYILYDTNTPLGQVTDQIYRIVDAPYDNDIYDAVYNAPTINQSIDFAAVEHYDNKSKFQIIASLTNVSAISNNLITTIPQKTAYGVSLATCTPMAFRLRWKAGTFTTVTARFKVNGVVVYVGSAVGAPVNTTALADLSTGNDLYIPIIGTTKMSSNSSHLIEVEVMVGAASCQFDIDVIGYKYL